MTGMKWSVGKIRDELNHLSFMTVSWQRFWEKAEKTLWEHPPSALGVKHTGDEIKEMKKKINQELDSLLEALRAYYPHAVAAERKRLAEKDRAPDALTPRFSCYDGEDAA